MDDGSQQDRKEPPLKGIRVLDLTRILAGPFAALILADLGAEIIKVEPPDGEPSRLRDPFYKGLSVRLVTWDRSRKGITLNLRQEKGKEVFKELVRCSDVVLENFRPGVMERLGLSYDALKAIKPDVILTSITGYGQYGPYAHYPAHNNVIVSFSGLLDMTGFPGQPPVRPAGAVADATGGVYAVVGTLAALYRRQFTGKGEHVDISMMDCVLGFLANELLHHVLLGETPTREGNTARGRALRDVYQVKDGYVYIQADIDSQWQHLAEVVGRPELVEDPRFETLQSRGQHKEEVDRMIQPWLSAHTRAEVFEALARAGVPCSPVNSLVEVAQDPQVKARGMLQWVEHPTLGSMPVIGPLVKFDETPPVQPGPPPLLGEHNEEIYCGLLGYTREALGGFKDNGII